MRLFFIIIFMNFVFSPSIREVYKKLKEFSRNNKNSSTKTQSSHEPFGEDSTYEASSIGHSDNDSQIFKEITLDQ